MILECFDYLTITPKTDNMEADIINLLNCNDKQETTHHVINVSRVNEQLAEKFGLDKHKCVIGGLLHDISAIIEPEDMFKYAIDNNFELCEAERRFPFLLHQRISRVIANEYFDIIDEDILAAIECHTTLKKSPNNYEMALFIADKLAWDQDGTPPFYDAVNNALNKSLEKACYAYMSFMIDNNKVLYPHVNWTLGYESITEIVNNKIDSRCGLHCTGCEYKVSCGCGGCIETNGHPFHGECSVAKCCQDKGFTHCGECPEIPEACGETDCKRIDKNGFHLCDGCNKTTCGKLHAYSYTDPEHGDNPPGARIEQCKRWTKK